jgi:hypothetical protein
MSDQENRMRSTTLVRAGISEEQTTFWLTLFKRVIAWPI